MLKCKGNTLLNKSQIFKYTLIIRYSLFKGTVNCFFLILLGGASRATVFFTHKVKGLKIGNKSNFFLITFLFQYYAYLSYYNFIFINLFIIST